MYVINVFVWSKGERTHHYTVIRILWRDPNQIWPSSAMQNELKSNLGAIIIFITKISFNVNRLTWTINHNLTCINCWITYFIFILCIQIVSWRSVEWNKFCNKHYFLKINVLYDFLCLEYHFEHLKLTLQFEKNIKNQNSHFGNQVFRKTQLE